MTQLWLFLHVLASIVAFGTFFAAPAVTRTAGDAGAGLARAATYIQFPALVIVLFTGIMNAYAMEPREVFRETWISIAFTLWIVMAVVMFFLIRGHRRRSGSVQPLTGAMHVLLVIALWAMIWQPGAPG
jgi:cytochrome bd-type quinol oxidase subunit 2